MVGVLSHPSRFLELRVHRIDSNPSVTGLCVGYERGNWRSTQFADHLMEWLPEFALKYSEQTGIDSANMVSLIRQAAKAVYTSKKFEKRGEFGELFIHAAIRQVFNSIPAISKIYYKSATNKTVDGFDAVHVVGPPHDMELWLGEAKFYTDIKTAIRDVVAEIKKHTKTNYLRNEFMLIGGKIDATLPHASALKDLLSHSKSLDEVFKRTCIAVLLTYDSDCVAAHTICNDAYIKAFTNEIDKHYTDFVGAGLPDLRIHLFLLPLKSKKELVAALDKKLKTWQKL